MTLASGLLSTARGAADSVTHAPPPISAHDVAVLVFKSMIVMTVLVAGFRLFGKRSTSQLTVYDLAMLFALSNAVQNAMTAGRGNLVVGLATSSAVVVTAWGVGRLIVRAPRLEPAIVGSPTILVRDGQVLAGRLRQQHIRRDELAAAFREVGLGRPDDVALAVLEVDGSITIVPRDADAG